MQQTAAIRWQELPRENGLPQTATSAMAWRQTLAHRSHSIPCFNKPVFPFQAVIVKARIVAIVPVHKSADVTQRSIPLAVKDNAACFGLRL
jgi:hypothetical protein